MSEERKAPFLASASLSLMAWCFVAGGTISLSLVSLFVFWPLSLIFEAANGQLPHRISQFWSRTVTFFLPFWTIRTEGLEQIVKGRPYVIVSNHQSMLDILVLLAKLPLHFKFIAKRELFWIPLFGWHLGLARYICLNRGDPESGRACLEKARDWLRRGVSVVFFPEGTRSPDGEIHEFKAGAFKVAIEEKQDLLPLVIQGTREALPKYGWRLEKRSTFFLRVLEPVSVRNVSIEQLSELREKIRSRIVSEFEKLKGGRRS